MSLTFTKFLLGSLLHGSMVWRQAAATESRCFIYSLASLPNEQRLHEERQQLSCVSSAPSIVYRAQQKVSKCSLGDIVFIPEDMEVKSVDWIPRDLLVDF